MIKLTTQQAKVYEFIKMGISDQKTISELVGKTGQAVRRTALLLDQVGLISSERNGAKWKYKANAVPYEIVKKITRSDISADDEPRGKLNLTGYQIELTEKQKQELSKYRATTKEKRTEQRTKFAKRIGVPKLYLNFYLQLKEA